MQIRLKLGCAPSSKRDSEFMQMVYHLLGMLVGDAHRSFSPIHPLEARVELDLCRGHPENLDLGRFLADSVNQLGVSCRRIADSKPVPREPHGLYRWMSSYSIIVGWIHVVCHGLNKSEKTTLTSVRMDWLLSSSPEFRLWFLRGMADSDGTVAVRNKAVNIYTAPNSALVRNLLKSLGTASTLGRSKRVDYVAISARDAMRLGIFNTKIETHRGKMLARLASAKTYQRRWPNWLQEEVQSMLRSGFTVSQVRDKLLFEDGV